MPDTLDDDAFPYTPPPMHSLRRIKHKERGSTYAVTGTAIVQCERPIQDGEIVVLYQGLEDTGFGTSTFVRPPYEMKDGRFEDTGRIPTLVELFPTDWVETLPRWALPDFVNRVQRLGFVQDQLSALMQETEPGSLSGPLVPQLMGRYHELATIQQELLGTAFSQAHAMNRVGKAQALLIIVLLFATIGFAAAWFWG